MNTIFLTPARATEAPRSAQDWMAASGVSYPDLIDRLVAHGLARAGRGAVT